MTRLFFVRRLYRAEHRTPDRVAGLVLTQVERGVEVERLPEFVAALRDAVRRAVDERQVLVGPNAVGSAAQTLVKARLQELRRVRELAVFVGPHAEGQLLFASIRAEHRASGQSQRGEHETRRKPSARRRPLSSA